MLRSKRKGKQYVAIHAVIEKAYDRMEWALIVRALECFGFPTWFINWIYQCMSSVSYSILLNGSPYGFFKPSRGLRQGYPLSLLLFVIGLEVFSRLLFREESRGNLHGISIGRGVPPILHLLYANDLLIFYKADVREAQVLSSCLQRDMVVGLGNDSMCENPQFLLVVMSAHTEAKRYVIF